MNRLILPLATLASLLIGQPALAQPAPRNQPARQAGPDGPAPEITLMVQSADTVIRAVEFVMGLTGQVDQKQIPVVKDYLDIFLIGLDTRRPMRMDVITEPNTPLRYRPSFPVQNISQFTNNNLEGLGIRNRRIAGTVWSLSGAFEGFMRYHHGYGSFAERPFYEKDLPRDIPDPTAGLQPLLSQQYDFGVLLQNREQGVEFRHEMFNAQLRPELLQNLKPLENESEDEFAVRKLLYENRLDELERYYAEASYGEVGGRLLQDRGMGRVDLHIAPIPGTALDASIKGLGQKPSYFAGVPRAENTILSARVNFPLDPLRSENTLELFELLRSIEKKNIEAETEPAAEQKQARQRVVDLVFDLLAANAKDGLLDAFAEAHPNASGKNTAVGGFRTVDGTAIVGILEAMKEARPERPIEIGVDQAGDVRIHSFQISEERRRSFNDFFGSDTVYVGSSQDAVWLAAGENAIEELKAAIERAGQPAGNAAPAQFVTVYAKLLPWLELQSQQPEADDPGHPQVSKYRDIALQALRQGNDGVITLVAERDGNDLRGQAEAHTGILRFIGSAVAQFSRENLEDPEPAGAPQAGGR